VLLRDENQHNEKALKRHQLPADFAQKLKDVVDEYSSDDKGEITIEIAPM
jgi:hypothetical protein